MRRPGWLVPLLICASLSGGISSPPASSDLTIEQRVAAQRAIEQVYYSHQKDATLPFDEAVPNELIERKVRDYLRQSAALEQRWGEPITADMLRQEAARISRSTRMPERLSEIYAALGNDPVLILECLARPALASRLARARFAADGSDTSWDEWWQDAARSFDADGVRTLATPSDLVPQPEWSDLSSPEAVTNGCPINDQWNTGGALAPQDSRRAHAAVWTGSLMIVWGGAGSSGALNTGSRYDPVTDTSTPTSTIGAPASGPAVWTGSRMIVWNGNSGAAYNPTADTWSAISTTNAPAADFGYSVVWSGSRVIVFGGYIDTGSGWVYQDTGALYNPQNNHWDAMAPAPSARSDHTAVSTGSTMIVWGGRNSLGLLSSGARYDAQTDSWTPVSSVGEPVARWLHSAVWTGSRMIVWGGRDSGGPGTLSSGGLYDPALDSWTATSLADAPTARAEHTAVAAGGTMIVWGGTDSSSNRLGTGGRLDSNTNNWLPVATAGAPSPRVLHTAVWTGSRMIVWGGVPFGGALYSRYDPATDTWAGSPAQAFTTTGSGLWTGTLMVIYSGGGTPVGLERYDPILDQWTPATFVNAPSSSGPVGSQVWTGQRVIVSSGSYNPVADTWTAISTVGAPPSGPAVWTGTEVLVWNPGNAGGRYDPAADTWAPMSTAGAPAGTIARVWTGSEMIIPGTVLNPGGRYNPATDLWSSISMINGPQPSSGGRRVVWAGGRVVVWGGYTLTQECVPRPPPLPGCSITWVRRYPTDANSYDPGSDTWSQFNNLASGREDPSVISTGTEAVFWGGAVCSTFGCMDGGAATQNGFRVDPQTGSITSLPTAGAPSARMRSIAVWTGDEMIVWGGSIPNPQTALTLRSGGRLGIGPPPTGIDADADGFDASCDCDDTRASVHPGAPDVCDGLNNNCNDPFWPSPTFIEGDQDADGVTVCGGDCDDTRADVRPGAAQVCDGLNNDCDDPAWPGLIGTNEFDDDGDGLSECGADCDDANVSIWATPGEAQALEVAGSGMLTWSPPTNAGGTVTLYDAIRSSSASDFVGVATCVESNDGSDTSASDSDPLPAGAVLYYLVRAENGCPMGLGILGTDSNGTPRSGRTCP